MTDDPRRAGAVFLVWSFVIVALVLALMFMGLFFR
jgi:hypothetical protein